jgi:hypothetical protein
MQIDLDHLHYWMCAIRNSEDPKRTLDAFWGGQIRSKEWLISNLKPHIKTPVTIDILGGWVGVLSSMLFQSDIVSVKINSVDIDPSCESIAVMMNKIEEMAGRFQAITADMCEFDSNSDVVINTSCEHITQKQYDKWFSKLSQHSLIVLQSNNYNIEEHIRIATDLDNFKDQCHVKNILYSGEMDFPLYKRFMIIGKKDV